MREVDVVVVGAGVMGAATAWQLSGRGDRVVLLERFGPDHTRGSSHGPSRIFRFSYADPEYVRMAMEALPLWRRLERESGRAVVIRLGGLDVGGDLDAHARALESCDAPFDLLTGAEARRRFPGIGTSAEEPALFQPDAGIVLADVAVRTLTERARACGAEVRHGARVLELRPDGDRAVVRTPGEEIRAGAVVVTAGAWARDLLAPVGIDLPVTPTRQTVAYFPMAGELAHPIVVDWAEPLAYALADPGRGMKAGLHRPGPVADPDEEGRADSGTVSELAAWVSRRLPAASPRPARVETCLYTSTEDERFVLERHGPVVVGSPCSGHGFKFAPLIGRRLAALAGER